MLEYNTNFSRWPRNTLIAIPIHRSYVERTQTVFKHKFELNYQYRFVAISCGVLSPQLKKRFATKMHTIMQYNSQWNTATVDIDLYLEMHCTFINYDIVKL